MGAVDYTELIKMAANVVVIPAVSFIWRTLKRIDRMETKMDILLKFHGLEDVVKAADEKPASLIIKKPGV